jgi:GNAT superfamily N-acetyltransferase
MVPASPPTGVFDTELTSARGEDWLETYLRQRMVVAEVAELFVARDDAGAPIYAQWLVKAEHWARLDRFAPGRYPQLGRDEGLVEGAFTFPRFRGLGVMADGMAQLLAIARDAGSRSVLTYVGDANVPSLRGCARVGFDLDHVRVNRRRLGRRSSTVHPVDDAARRAWEAATRR